MAWWGVSSAMFCIYLSATLAVTYGVVDTAIGIALTIVAYHFINAIISKYATLNRSTVAQFSRTILGTAGAYIATVIFALVAIYYAVFEGQIVSFAIQTQFGLSAPLSSLIVVVVATPLIFGGLRRTLDKLNGFLLPIYVLGLIAAAIWAIVKYGHAGAEVFTGFAPVPLSAGGPGWLAVFAAYMGIWILMMFAMDYAAGARRRDIRFHRHFTFGWSFYTVMYGFSAVIGIILVATIPGMAVSEAGIAGGIVVMMGWIGLVVIAASQIRINTANYYLGTTNLQAVGVGMFRIKLPYFVWVLITAALIYLLMLLPITAYLLVALAWQGVVVTSWVAIAMTHMLLVGDKRHEPGNLPDTQYARVNRVGIIAWGISTAVGLLMLQLFRIDDSLAGIGSTWGPIVTCVLAAALYAILWKTTDTKTALLDSSER